jgi:hypothetical protein
VKTVFIEKKACILWVDVRYAEKGFHAARSTGHSDWIRNAFHQKEGGYEGSSVSEAADERQPHNILRVNLGRLDHQYLANLLISMFSPLSNVNHNATGLPRWNRVPGCLFAAT